MKVIVTGAGGFLGSRVADALLAAPTPDGLTLSEPLTELILVDVTVPAARPDPRVRSVALDLASPGAADTLLSTGCDVLFHLAAVVSGHAEVDLELGLRVNLDATRALLDAVRRRRRVPITRLVFTSTVGVFGGPLPAVVDDLTAVTPQNSYGTAKAMSELLINDYARRGLVDARVVRLPTVSVRAGAPNRAVTSFASGIVREPLAGLPAACPVPADLPLWLTSPGTAVRNIMHAARLAGDALGAWRVVNLPGLRASPRDMVRALERVAGPRVAGRVRFEPDEQIAQMVETFPSQFDNSRALSLGFAVDKDFEDIIRAYIRDDLKGKIVQ